MSEVRIYDNPVAINIGADSAAVTVAAASLSLTVDDDSVAVAVSDDAIAVTVGDESVALSVSDVPMVIELPTGPPAGGGGSVGNTLTAILTLGETIAPKAFVTINASGQVINADADNHRRAVAWCETGGASGASATVTFSPAIITLSGLTPGAYYYLSATAGGYTATLPTTAGHYRQQLGVAISATDFYFNAQPTIIL